MVAMHGWRTTEPPPRLAPPGDPEKGKKGPAKPFSRSAKASVVTDLLESSRDLLAGLKDSLAALKDLVADLKELATDLRACLKNES